MALIKVIELSLNFFENHSFTDITVYEEYIDCILVFVIWLPEFQKTNSDHLAKRKIRYATSVAIFWDKFNKILRPNFPAKLNSEHCEKMNIKTVVIYISMSNYNLFGEFQIVGPTLAKRKNGKILRNRHWIHNQYNTSNSCAKFHLIWE